jgi:putative hydrolase of the HAD superfamily
MNTKNIRAVIFDIDDTLFDRIKAQTLIIDIIIRKLPQAFGSLSRDKILDAFFESDRISTDAFYTGEYTGSIRDYRSKLFLRSLGVSEDFADDITKMYVEEYPAVDAPVDGAVALVKEIKRRYKVGAVSNGLPDVQYRKLESLGLRDLFDCIVLSEEISIRKPDPAIFQRAADLLGVAPAQCLCVGNSYDDDVLGAKAAGMSACWFCRGVDSPQNPPFSADFVINSLKQLSAIL